MPELKQEKYFAAVLWLLVGLGLGIGADRLLRQGLSTGKNSSSTHQNPARGAPVAAVSPGSNAVAAPEEEIHGTVALERLRPLVRNWNGTDIGACMTLINQLCLAECCAAFDMFGAVRREEREVLQRAVARRWARLDADAVLAKAMQMADSGNWRMLGEEAAREIVRRNPDAAVTKILEASGLHRLIFASLFLPELAEKQPARAGALLTEHPEFAPGGELYRIVSDRWAQSDPRAAIAWAASLPNRRVSKDAAKFAWLSWATQDPETVAAEIARAPDTRFEQDVLAAVTERWSKRDPRAALAWITSLPRKTDQENALWAFNPDVHRLGTDGMFNLLNDIPSEAARIQVAGKVSAQLADADPQAAFAWADRFPPQTRERLLRPALDELVMADPARAMNYITALPVVQGRADLMRTAMCGWALQDAEAALAWSRQLPAGPDRQRLIIEVVGEGNLFVNPGQWLELIPEASVEPSAAEKVAGQWCKTDGTAAAQWLDRLPNADAKTRGYYSIGRQWTFVDPDATERWMNSLSAGPLRDKAICGFVQTMDGSDPALATTWAAAIEDPKERRDKVLNTFNRLMQRDLSEARAWLDHCGIDGPLRAELNSAIQTGPIR